MTRQGLRASGLGVFLLGMALTSTSDAATWYVDDDAAVAGDGQSWSTAFRFLQDALHACATGDEIRVAAGRYTPDRDEAGLVTRLDRYASFALVDGVALGGGYAGINAADPDARNILENESVLSGDLAQNDTQPFPDRADNSVHVLTAAGVSDATRLEGVVIEGGATDSAPPDSPFIQGGGLYSSGSNLQVARCILRYNYAFQDGGAIFHGDGGTITIKGCFFYRNQADWGGGGVLLRGQASAVVRNCTFVDNVADDYAAGLGVKWSVANVANCIFWNNRLGNTLYRVSDQGQIDADGSSGLELRSCCVSGWTGALGGSGNFGTDPRLVRRGFRLQTGSRCIDAGDPALDYTGDVDLDGDSIVSDGSPDIGADAFVDTDTDGLPDAWEQQHFESAVDGVPDEDPDSDGLTTGEEYDQSTSPLVPRKIIHVDPLGDDTWDGLAATWDGVHGPKVTLRSGVSATGPGEVDVVLVHDGLYTGPDNRNVHFPGHDLMVRSENGPTQCIIDCAEAGRAFLVDQRETQITEIRGFTIRNGRALDAPTNGGGICCDRSDLTITNCVVAGCRAGDDNAGGSGGGFFVRGSLAPISECVAYGNLAYEGNGGGIYIEGGRPRVTGCRILANAADPRFRWPYPRAVAGGGICFLDSDAAVLDSFIAGNRAAAGGGVAALCGAPETIRPRIRYCEIWNNTARFSRGGGIYMWRGVPAVSQCVVARNEAYENGAGIAFLTNGTTNIAIANCTVVENSLIGVAGGRDYQYAGGIYGALRVTNSMLWGNSANQVIEYALVEFSAVQGGQPGAGNFSTMPVFAVPGDWHPTLESPGLDAGTNDPFGFLQAHDLEHVPLPQDGDGDGSAISDVGAYEYQPGLPRLAVAPAWIEVSAVLGSEDVLTVDVSLGNCGEGTLDWTIIENVPWLDISQSQGQSTSDVSTVQVMLSTSDLSVGLHLGEIAIQAAEVAVPQRRIPVLLRVRPVRRVPSQHADIGSAILAAGNGDIIQVADGVYTYWNNKNLSFGGKSLIVRSEQGPDNCIIDCEGEGSAFIIQDGEAPGTTIEGFTIRNASQSGIRVLRGAQPTIRNCRLTHNRAENGGGLSVLAAGARIEATLVTQNEAWGNGGGIAAEGSYLQTRDCEIRENTSLSALPDRGGGGLYLLFSRAFLGNTLVVENHSAGAGGGVDFWYPVFGRFGNCVIAGNTAPNGGGIQIQDSPLGGFVSLMNCLVAGNTATSGDGGGLSVVPGERKASLRLWNCTIAGNQAEAGGGGLACKSGDVFVRNTVATGNVASVGREIALREGGSLDADRSAILGGLADVWTEPGSGNIVWGSVVSEDPGLQDPDGPDRKRTTWADGNYSVRAGSPCIDAGNNSNVLIDWMDLDGNDLQIELTPFDAAGLPRLADDPAATDAGDGDPPIVDMGAFEYQDDCNGNGVIDSLDLVNGTSADCTGNGVPDECELDCDGNGLADVCELDLDPGLDANGNRYLDACEVLYVSASASGAGTGRSWADAINDLQDALSLADTSPTPVSQIWVARGTYRPDSGTEDRTRSFTLRDGLGLYGGFAGWETRRTQRRLQSHPTILSAYLGQPPWSADNAYHVVDGSGVGPTAVLDGFVIERGRADGPAAENAHKGAGILIIDGSPTVRRCIIRNNHADGNGGGVSIVGNSHPAFESCVFVLNVAGGNGGAVQAYQCGLTLMNCTAAGNSASGAGDGIFLNGTPAVVTSCIAWGNDQSNGYPESGQIHVLNCTPSLNYNCVQNWSGTLPGAGVGNIGANPQFISQPIQVYGDTRLRFGSPAINAGDPTVAPEPDLTDVAGDLRVRCGRADMGAYEYGRHDPDCDGIIELEESIEAVPIPTANAAPGSMPAAARGDDAGKPAR